MKQQADKNATKKLPWYKYPWVWFVISLPASAVIAGLYTVYVAQQHAPQVITKQHRFLLDDD